jgi:hypothetical protein
VIVRSGLIAVASGLEEGMSGMTQCLDWDPHP